MKKFILTIFILGTVSAHGQSNDWWVDTGFSHWQMQGASIGFGNYHGFVAATDTINHLTYVAGPINPAFYDPFIVFDGDRWTIIGAYDGGGSINAMCMYHGYLYVGSRAFTYEDTLDNQFGSGYLSRYDGENWEHVYPMDGEVTGLKVIDDTLYIGGKFDVAGPLNSPRAVKFDGENWYPIPDNPFVDMPNYRSINAFAKYQGELYMGGLSPDVNDEDLMVYHNGIWQAVGEGVPGLNTKIDFLEVYQDELYAGGIIYAAQGNAGNGIQKWNGETWSQVGGGVNGVQTNDAQLFDGGLIVAGVFSHAGDAQVNGVALWDGTRWCGLHTYTQNQFIPGMFVLNDSLYMPLRQSETDPFFSDYSEVYKWKGGDYFGPCETVTGVDEMNKKERVSIFPNPAAEYTGIHSDDLLREVRIFELSGKLMKLEKVNSYFIPLDLTQFDNGMYIIQIFSDKETVTRKLLKAY